jgi:hypothetical protein
MISDLGTSPNIIWLEDRRDTIAQYKQLAEKAEIKCRIFSTPAEVIAFLTDILGPDLPAEGFEELRIGFVVDLMLFGVSDLRSLGVENASTGKGIHAGYVFVDRVLRARGSKYVSRPVCFLTERLIDEELTRDIKALAERGGGAIDIVRKYDDGYLPQFRGFLKRL